LTTAVAPAGLSELLAFIGGAIISSGVIRLRFRRTATTRVDGFDTSNHP
jgi:uncharacterized integral membrane protein